MYSLKAPFPATSIRWPFTVREAPGSVRPLTWRMLPRASTVSMTSRGNGVWYVLACGFVTTKREKSEKLPSTPSLSMAATFQ